MSRSPTIRNDQKKVRVLIIEDEPMIAFALEECLIEAGFEIAGVAGRLEAALTMIESGVFDVAILDTNLAGVSAGPAAVEMRARGLPFVVVSGYLPSQQHADFMGAFCLQKPCSLPRLIAILYDISTQMIEDRQRRSGL